MNTDAVKRAAFFAPPCKNGFHDNGLYRYSRNTMYLAYFIFFIGCAMLVQSVLFSTAVYYTEHGEHAPENLK